jgi:predicted transcriptional regulator
MNLKNLSLRDLAIYLSDYLFKNGIETVLSGGACVSIYTNNRYLSYDLDFVLLSYVSRKKIASVLEGIGFQEEGRHFTHKDTPFIVEFLAPPPSIGEEPIGKIVEIKRGGMVLKLLSSTDCVKDRLASFYHWNDKQSLEQAILVSLDNEIDLKEIQRWSIKEGMRDKLETFMNTLNKRKA